MQGQDIGVELGVAGTTGHVVTVVATDPAIGDNNTDDTSAAAPFTVKPSITDDRPCTATFIISSSD